MISLLNDIESLKALIQQLLEENTQLKAENAELRRRLGMDSGNSLPPSSDGYRKKTVKPGLPKDTKNPSGGQPGHQGKTIRKQGFNMFATLRDLFSCTPIVLA